jgi:H+/Cl- antiporter ClcA
VTAASDPPAVADAGAPAGHHAGGPVSARSYLRLTLLGAAIGIPAALVAAALFAAIRVLQDWLWSELPATLGYAEPPWFLVLAIPVVGAVLVVIARRALPGDGGHSPLHGLDPGPAPLRYAPGIILAALGTLCFGAVLGPEMPVIALGAITGTAFAQAARVEGQGRTVLAMAGSFSAISALFGGPLVAGMLLVEGGLSAGAQLLRVLLPGLVAAAIGYTIFVGLGDWGGISEAPLAVPDLATYEGTTVVDLAVGLGVGIVAALLVVATKAAGVMIDRRSANAPLVIIGGGAAIGVLAIAASALGAQPEDVLFSGQASIPVLVGESSTIAVLVLLVAKAIGYAISLGTGFRGGPIFPAIFLGVAVASVGVSALGMSPTLAIAIGASAGMAAQTQLLISPLLFAALLVGPAGADAMPAAVLATVGAWLTVELIDRRRAIDGGTEVDTP